MINGAGRAQRGQPLPPPPGVPGFEGAADDVQCSDDGSDLLG